MDIVRAASAGTVESSDVYVELEPCEGGISLELDSVVIEQFGERIESVVREVLEEQGVKNASVRIQDKGALECVIRARVECAVRRGKEVV